MFARSAHSSWLRPSLWLALAVLAACIPFVGALSLTRIFHLRDLTMFFWPTHLWLRETLLSGAWPAWDPYAAGGQPTDPNALNQMFFPPVLLLRVLLPPVIGFNAIVATPFPIAALGMWLFLRRRVSGPSSTVGAIVFAASGPMVSSGNFPNLSWSMAALPWLLWTLDREIARPSNRSLAAVTLVSALLMLAGEPVTMLGTLALASFYVLTSADAPATWTDRARRVARFGVSTAIAGAIAAIQLAPTALASRDSLRSQLTQSTFWSLHPVWLTEALMPRFFGHAFENWQAELPWLWPLNSNRDPLFYSLYLGGLMTVLAITGARMGLRRWTRLWVVVGVVSLLCAFGRYTPFYPFLQHTLPLVGGFRFPLKFFLFTAFALAVLAAEGVSAWADATRGAAANRVVTRTTVIASVLVAVLIGAFTLAPFVAARAGFELARWVGLPDPVEGAAFLFRSVSTVAVRVLAVLALGALVAFIGIFRAERRAFAVGVFCLIAVADLLLVNATQNPLMDVAQLGPPSWTQAVKARPTDRFYFGGKFGGRLVVGDRDLAQTGWESPIGSFAEARTQFMAQLAMAPAGWHIREILSHDLPLLRPVVQMEPLGYFLSADRATRLRFLARSGVRYCVLGEPPFEGAAPLAQVGNGFSSMAVYECIPDARRAYVVPEALIEPSGSVAVRRLFDADFPAESTVMLEGAADAPAGTAGPPATASAQIVVDEDRRVEVDASAPTEGGYLVLLDTFDPTWRVDVDGAPATLLRANGLFRAVRLAPGTHRVRFQHQHTILKTWLPVSALGSLILAVIAIRPSRTRESAPESAVEPRAA